METRRPPPWRKGRNTSETSTSCRRRTSCTPLLGKMLLLLLLLFLAGFFRYFFHGTGVVVGQLYSVSCLVFASARLQVRACSSGRRPHMGEVSQERTCRTQGQPPAPRLAPKYETKFEKERETREREEKGKNDTWYAVS